MAWYLRCRLYILFSLVLPWSAVVGSVVDTGMVAWLQENGGFFSDKIEFRALDPNDAKSPNGLFAKASLQVNETIMVIPHKCLLTSPEGTRKSICNTARALVDHYRKGDQSFFQTYVNYLFDGNKRGRLPDRWSDAAKDIVETFIGDELPSPFFGKSFEDDCGGGSGDPIEEDAYDFVLARSWTEIMIPVYDMVNHRNGHWRNVEATSAHIGEDITVYAYRDVEANEQLYISYNECLDTDCEGIALSYGTSMILADYGFVEEFPQRWIWEDVPSFNGKVTLVLELEQVIAPDPYNPTNQTTQLHVKWHTAKRPDLQTISYLQGHINALEALDTYVHKATADLLSEHERYTIREYHKALKQALYHTIWAFYDEAIDELGSEDEGEENQRHYDTLEERPPIGNPEGNFLSVCYPDHEDMGRGYVPLFEVDSQFQTIEYKYGVEEDDTCLWLSGWGQTCSSFRQYHEALVHYPASFLPEIKRVVYLGGGDNMILHEILKYPTIELVVGMELDPEVVRYSFMNLGTLPYFDDPRVQWWFGDATKTLRMLPESYFGSFDLVLVDLETYVADALFVTDTLSFMDTMKLLVKEPYGIISKNEDFPNRKILDFARYTVDLEYCDLPQICRQSITIGSNGIDFLTAPQYNHNIHTIYITDSLQLEGRFNNWYSFRDNNDTMAKKARPKNSAAPSGKTGVLVVIEAEELSGTVEGIEDIGTAVTKSLGENKIEVLFTDTYTRESSSDFDLYLTFRQGFVAVHKRPVAESYVAMDLVLWDEIDHVNDIKTALISSLGGNEQTSTSSYRLVIGGIKGSDAQPFLMRSPRELGTCDNPERKTQESDEPALTTLSVMIQLLPETTNNVLVVCGSYSDACQSLEALRASSMNAVGLFGCHGIAEGSSKESDLVKCEIEIMQKIRTSMSTSSKVNAIWLDAVASKNTARALLRLLTSQTGRLEVLNKSYVVMAPLTTETWREQFVKRFLMEISPFFPSNQARLFLPSEDTLLFFSAGNEKFYDNLLSSLSKLQSEGQKLTLENVVGGHPSYTPNFAPKFFNNKSFDNTRAFQQWNSQKSILIQTILQMELKAPKTPLTEGDIVLYQTDDHIRYGIWVKAKVVKQLDDLTYLVNINRSGAYIPNVARDALRRLDFDISATPLPTIDIGARVLYRVRHDLDHMEHWEQGFVVSRFADDRKYEIRINAGSGAVIERDVEDVMPQDEGTREDQLPGLSLPLIEKVFRKALTIIATDNDLEFSQQSHSIGDGCVLTAAWKQGTAVVVWDGDKHIDINLLVDEDDDAWIDLFHTEFLNRIPFLAPVRRDEQPRGFGSVVNFEGDIRRDVDPIWWPKSMDEDHNEDLDEDENDDNDEEHYDDQDEEHEYEEQF